MSIDVPGPSTVSVRTIFFSLRNLVPLTRFVLTPPSDGPSLSVAPPHVHEYAPINYVCVHGIRRTRSRPFFILGRPADGVPRCARPVRLRRRSLRSRDGRIEKRVGTHGSDNRRMSRPMERTSPFLCASSGSVVAKAPSQFMDLLTPPWHAIPHESSSRPFSCRLLVRRVGGAGCPLRYPHVDTTFHG